MPLTQNDVNGHQPSFQQCRKVEATAAMSPEQIAGSLKRTYPEDESNQNSKTVQRKTKEDLEL